MGNVSFLSHCFQDFFFPLFLVFRNVVLMCLGMPCFGCLCCLGFSPLLKPVGLCLLPNLASFSHYFFKISFSSILSLSFWDSNIDMEVLLSLCLKLYPLFFFFSPFSLCCSDWGVNSIFCSQVH